jgi:predicted MPP superfamily phosphohydrolase
MTQSTQERSLAERVEQRIEIERFFARARRTYRKSRFKLWRQHRVAPPLLKLALRATGLYGRGVKNALHPVIRRLRLDCDRLPAALNGFTILHLSDFHIDGNRALPDQLVSAIRGLTPDLCVLTGDYRFDTRGPSQEVYEPMQSILSSISSKHGVFGILGNHDVAEIAFALETMGVRMLVNEGLEICEGSASLWLAGIDDPFDYRCDDLPRALWAVPPDAFKILLAHTPDLYRDAAERGVDVYLCGHTHAGQIRFPLIGALDYNSNSPRAYGYGHWTHKRMHGYTTSGVGCSGLPVRFNCPPEVALIELRTRLPAAELRRNPLTSMLQRGNGMGFVLRQETAGVRSYDPCACDPIACAALRTR